MRMFRWVTAGLTASLAAATLTGVPLSAQHSSTALVSVQFDNTPLRDAIRQIAERSTVNVTYSATMIPADRLVTYRGTNVTPEEALRAVLKKTNGIAVERLSNGGLKVWRAVSKTQAIQGVIIGKIIHAKTKQPISGATIQIDDTKNAIHSQPDGTFRLTAKAGEHTISVRAVGFVRQTQKITVSDGQSVTVEIVLEPSANVLNEVIVTGTVVATERRAIANPITIITSEELEKRAITRIDQLFRGEVPGVFAMDNGMYSYDNRRLGEAYKSDMYVRGTSSFGGKANPLKTYVDGVEIVDPLYIGTIDPQSIERIEIITGPQAATVYGSGAMGGVMQIFTKSGIGKTHPELTLRLKYGMIQSNTSNSLAPAHNHTATVAGGRGGNFSYSATLSHTATGQWQPKLFSKSYGLSAGTTWEEGPVMVRASANASMGSNGTIPGTITPMQRDKTLSGEWRYTDGNRYGTPSQKIGMSSSHTITAGIDYRANDRWQHHFTLGKSVTVFQLRPSAPEFMLPPDTLFSYQRSNGARTSGSYNTTVAPIQIGWTSSTLTLGVTGSSGDVSAYQGSAASNIAASLTDPTVTQASTNNFGGFASLNLGVASRVYFNLGLRGERNPAYGREHAIDWTPTNGVTVNFDIGELTAKLQGSYGSATRPPNLDQRRGVLYVPSAYYVTDQKWTTYPNPHLAPERERGPQGGIELYYGSIATLTINHYRQSTVDMLLPVVVDSAPRRYIPTDTILYYNINQWVNIAEIGKKGWEGTASVNVGALQVKGTYSWNDTRVRKLAPGISSYRPDATTSPVSEGDAFGWIASHMGNITVNYAHRGTSVTVVSNWIGDAIGHKDWYALESTRARIRTYQVRSRTTNYGGTSEGYIKTNLAMSHRLSRWLTADLHITNLGNSYGTDTEHIQFSTVMGRRTTVGFSIRYP